MERCPIAYPCALCKINRRKCGDKCLLAPYFPPEDTQKILIAHKVFETRNILKILRDVPNEKRRDAVISMVYEASARLNDPVYGFTGVVCKLGEELSHIQSQLATAQSVLVKTHENLLFLMAFSKVKTGTASNLSPNILQGNDANEDKKFVLEDVADPFCLWKPL